MSSSPYPEPTTDKSSMSSKHHIMGQVFQTLPNRSAQLQPTESIPLRDPIPRKVIKVRFIPYNIQMPYAHEEDRKANSRNYYERNRERLLANGRAYREAHPEKVQESRNGWYEKNKEKYLNTKNRKVECECGKTISWNNRHEHYRSKYHQKHAPPPTSIK